MRQMDVAVPRPVTAPHPLAQYASSLWAQLLAAQPAVALRFLCYLGGLSGFNVVPALQGAAPLLGQRAAAVLMVASLLAGLGGFYLAGCTTAPRWLYRLWPQRCGLLLGGVSATLGAAGLSVGVLAALPLTVMHPHHYANDAVAATECATHLFVQGHNPYAAYNLVACFARHGLTGVYTTPLQAGVFAHIRIYPPQQDLLRAFAQVRRAHVPHPALFESYFSYPAGAFLLPAPFAALGWHDMSTFYLLWALLAYGLLVRWAPRGWRPWLLVLAGANAMLWTTIADGQSNVLDVFLIVAGWATWRHSHSDDIAALLGLMQAVNGAQAPRLLPGRDAAMPYVTMDSVQTSAGALISAVQRGAAGWDGRSPRFIAVIGLAWDLMPGDFLSAMNTLRGQSAQYVFVRDDQLMRLMRQARHLPPRNTNATVFPFDSGTDGFIGATSGKRDDHARWDSTIGNPPGSLLLDGSDRGRPSGRPTAWFSQTLTLPAHATTVTFETRSLDGRHGGRLRVRLVDACGTSHTLLRLLKNPPMPLDVGPGISTIIPDVVVSTHFFSSLLLRWETYRSATWAGRTATLAAYARQMVTLYFEQDDNGAGPGEQRWLDNVVIHVGGLRHKGP